MGNYSHVLVFIWLITFVSSEPLEFVTSSNYTSYKLNVPGSDPITIIESNSSPSPDYENRENNSESKLKVINRRNVNQMLRRNENQNLKSAGRLRVKNQNIQTQSVGLQVSEPAYPSLLKNDYGQYTNSSASRKNKYSPELLEKFLKEYSAKIQGADEGTRKALKEIESINRHKSSDRIDIGDYIDDENDNDDGIVIPEEKFNRPWNNDQRKAFNDKDGWVTLEAVPWSTSKVSKWHPNKQSDDRNSFSSSNHHNNRPNAWDMNDDDDDRDNYRPFSSKPKPRPRPQYSYYDEPDADFYDRRQSIAPGKPIYTSYNPDRNRPTESESRPPWQQNYDQQASSYEKKPNYAQKPRPYNYDHSDSSFSDGPSSFGDNYETQKYTKPYKRPWSEDIVADNQQQPSTYSTRKQFNRPNKVKGHPSTYPENGDGEWILISSTKGYQPPVRQGHALSMPQKYHSSLKTRKSVKLTVLPLNRTFSYDSKPILSHGGLLEIDPSFQSIDSAVSAALRKNSTKTGTKKKKVIKGTPVKGNKGTPVKAVQSHNGNAVMAAVGASMVPATVAMLMPMVLGRRRRNANQKETIEIRSHR